MHAFLAGLAIGILGGGFGGYEWGRSVEAKAQALLAAGEAKVKAVTTAIKK